MIEHLLKTPPGEIQQCGLFEVYEMNIHFKSLSKDDLIAEIERIKKVKTEGCPPCQEKRRIYLKQLQDQLWEKYLKGEGHESVE